MKEWTVKLALAAVAGFLMALVGGWDKGLTILSTCIVLDILSGVARAIIQKKLSSNVSWRGGVKKVLIFMVVAVATQADLYAETDLARNGAIAFYVASEGLSILENVAASGVPLPPALLKILEALGKDKFLDEPPSD